MKAGWAALAASLALFGWLAPSRMRQWGATTEERVRPVAGEELLLTSGPVTPETRAITVNAPPAVTWEWLRRIGQGRGGFYSYDWLENLAGDDVHNRRELFPAEPMTVGDTIRLTQESYPGARTGLSLLPVAQVIPGRSFVLPGWGVFVVESLAVDRSRVIVRERPPAAAGIFQTLVRNLVWEPAHFVMERQMLRGLRDRAEGAPPPTVGHITASAGLALGGVFIVTLLIARRRWRWILLPTVVATAVFLVTGGVEASLAGFVAFGMPGVIWTLQTRGRALTLVQLLAVVLLVLLAAPDAYVALGFLLGIAVTAALVIGWPLVQAIQDLPAVTS